MVFGFGLFIVAALLLEAGISGRSLAEIVRGEAGKGGGLFDNLTANAAPASVGADVAGGAATITGKAPTHSAKALVDYFAKLGERRGAEVVSAYRPGDPKDHGSNDADKAARDIAKPGVDAISGPPSPMLDRVCEDICASIGQKYTPGEPIVEDFRYGPFRVQIIWRTPAYGGHLGHIHAGAKQVAPLRKTPAKRATPRSRSRRSTPQGWVQA